MQQFIHLPAKIQCSPQRSKQPQHPFPIGYLEIRFLQQAPGLPVVFLSLAICGTQGGIQVWSLQVTITAPLLLLWRSSSFVSSQRSHHCAAVQIPLPKHYFNSTSQVDFSWTTQRCSIHARILSLYIRPAHPVTIWYPKFFEKLCL